MSAEATVRMRALREAPLWLLAGAVLAFLVADRGTVAPLSREDYKKEVNEAGDGVGVVVFLSKSKGHYLSSYTLVLLEQLARKFSDVKFLRIESTDCIPGYPDGNLPTLLIYRDDELLRQCTGPSAFGGKSFSIDSVEWELAQSGIIKTDIGKCPHEKPSTATRRDGAPTSIRLRACRESCADAARCVRSAAMPAWRCCQSEAERPPPASPLCTGMSISR